MDITVICPEYIEKCIEMLENAGFSAYAVGGAVRDSIMGREPSDWDVATSATPEQMMEVFSSLRTVPTGIKHGTLTVLVPEGRESVPVEITTYRIDGEYRDFRHPVGVTFAHDITDDLSRRDLTVNAMAYNERIGLIDPFGGVTDIEGRLIRTVGEPKKRFSEDALRILRAFRFAAQLDFEIDEGTLLGAADCVQLLSSVARERVLAELKKLLSSPTCARVLTKAVECGVWRVLFPDLPTPSEQTVAELDRIGGSFAPRMAHLVCEYSDRERAAFLDSLHPSSKEKSLVLGLCEIEKIEPHGENPDAEARRFLSRYQNDLDDAVEMLKIREGEPKIDALLRALDGERTKKNPITLADLAVRGDDVLPFCEGDRRKVGKILNDLLSAVIENPDLNDREALLKILKNK